MLPLVFMCKADEELYCCIIEISIMIEFDKEMGLVT